MELVKVSLFRCNVIARGGQILMQLLYPLHAHKVIIMKLPIVWQLFRHWKMQENNMYDNNHSK